MEDDKDRNRFILLILDETESKSHSAWTKAHGSLLRYPDQLSALISDARYQTKFLTNFQQCATSIVQFLQTTGNKEIGNLITTRLVIPLLEQQDARLGQQYRQLTEEPLFFDVLHTTLRLTDNASNGLRNIAMSLGNFPRLLGKLLSSNHSENFLEELINSLGQGHPHAPTLAAWTDVVANLCDACEAGHNNDVFLDQWEQLKTLRDQVNQARNFLKHNKALKLQYSDEIKAIFRKFRVEIPVTEAAASSAIEHVEITLTFDLLSRFVKSMPCRVCFASLSGDKTLQASAGRREEQTFMNEDPHDLENSGKYEELLGQRLGCWKIVLSAQALKDIRKSKSEGNFEHIRDKVIDLSTGDWIRRSVAKPVTLPNISFKVRIFEAIYNSNGRILWQVDQGFDEGENKQIVRVWRIGDVKEVKETYTSVFRNQNTWSRERIDACKLNVIDETRGIKVPAFLNGHGQEENTEPTVSPVIFKDRTSLDVLTFGKFHVLTTTVLDSIMHDNHDAEFPFDVSSTETQIIKHFKTAAFVLGRSGTGKTTCLLYKLFCRYLSSTHYVGIENRLRQVLLTRSRPLARKLKLELYRLISTQLLAQGTSEFAARPTLTTEDSELQHLATKSLFSLQPEDFPLVCTFEEFLTILENTIRTHDRRNFNHILPQERLNNVDFKIFKAAYWPRIGSRHLDPGIVYSEIMGVIKGGGSPQNNFRSLTRDEYIEGKSILTRASMDVEREQVYSMYEKYELLKSQNHQHDGIDHILSILSDICQPRMKRKLCNVIQEIYVDEVQDQRALEVALLLHLVQNPRGIHFAGDSAQCISNDSVFRFATLKRLFHDHYLHIDPELAKPELFRLSKNFRSHQGILSFASFVMSLLWKGFPNLVDKLDPEIGQFQGPKPIIFVGSDVETLLIKVGGLNSAQDQQIIIVRDEETGTALEPKLGGNSIVYTILESKGMEYDDVFLYNFFSSSPYPSGWRTLETLLREGANHSYASQHFIMCSELKESNSLWILETKQNAFIDMLVTRLDRQLVDVRQYTDQTVDDLIQELKPMTATTKAEWNTTGDQCMDQKLYSQALKCYQNSGDAEKVLWATACIAEEKGREHRAKGEVSLFKQRFREAADGFLAINKKWKAAECFEGLNEFVRAAVLWETLKVYERAGDLYERVGRDYVLPAVRAYYNANLPLKAFYLLLRAKLYKELIAGLTRYQNDIPDEERKELAQELNMLYDKNKIPKELGNQIFNLLTTDEEKKEFLKKVKKFKELWDFLKSRGKLDEAMDELIDADKLDLLLENSFQAEREWQNLRHARLVEIFNYINAQKILTAISASASEKKLDEVFSSLSKSPYITLLSETGWRPILGSNAVGDSIRRRILVARDVVETMTPWSADFLAAILILHPEPYVAKVDSLAQLAITMKYLESMSTSLSKSVIPVAMLTCLGLLWSPGGRYRPLPQSTLVTNWTTTEKKKTLTNAEVTRYLRTKLKTALEQLLEKAKLNVLKIFNLCTNCVRQADWAVTQIHVQEAHNTRGCYSMQTSVIFHQHLYDMIETCRLLGIIVDPKANQSSEFATKVYDDFVSQLIRLLCYQSSYSHDAAGINQIAKRLSTEGQYELLRERIKDLIPRPTLNDPNCTQRDFFLLFRSHRLLRILGLSLSLESYGDESDQIPILVNIGTVEKAVLTIPEISEENQEPKLAIQFHLELLNCYHMLQSATSEATYPTKLELIRKLIENLRTFIYSTKRVSFDSELVSIFEDIGMMLLFTGWQTELLIPKSWKERYLPHWECFFTNTTKDEFHFSCRKAFHELFLLFSELVNWIIDQAKRIEPTEWQLLIRRSLDFMILGLVNMGMTGGNRDQADMEYHDLSIVVRKVLRKRSIPTLSIRELPTEELLKPLLNAFKFYNDKDHLCLTVCRSQEGFPLSPTMATLKTLGVQVDSRPTCSRGHQGCGTLEKSLILESSLLMVMIQLNAVNMIQRWFRKYLKRRAQAKMRAATVILRYYRNYSQRRAEKRSNAARIIQTAYRNYKRRRAELQAQELVRRVCRRYKRDRDYIRSLESKSVREIQHAFRKQREQKPNLDTKEYYTRIVIILTEGIELSIESAKLEERCESLLKEAKTGTQKRKITELRRLIRRVRDELCKDSDRFQGLNFNAAGLRNRIAEGIKLVKEKSDDIDAAEESIKQHIERTKNQNWGPKGDNGRGNNEGGTGRSRGTQQTKYGRKYNK